MIIKRVEFTNLKGGTASYDLASMNVVTGNNFSGKTRLIDAIRLAIIGYLPELGKTNAATWQLASGQEMSVQVEFDDDEDIALIARLEKGTPKITRLGQGFVWDSNPQIPLLNASAYFAMSERERYDYVFRIAKLPDTFTINSIVAECERISFEEEHTEAIEDAKREVIAQFGKQADLAFFETRDWLEAVVPALSESFTKWNARSKDTQGAIRVLAELKNRQETMAGNVRQLAAVKTQATAESETANKSLMELQTGAANYVRYQERLQRVKELTSALDPSAEVAKVGTRIDEATAMLKKDIDSKVSEAELEQLQSHVDRLRRDYSAAFTEVTKTKQDLGVLAQLKECPYCKSKGKDWKSNLHASFTETLTLNESKVKGAESGLGEAEKRLSEAKSEVARATADLAHNRRLNEQILGWNQQIGRLNRQRDTWTQQLDREQELLAKEKCEPVESANIDEAAEKCMKVRQALRYASERLRAAELLEHELKRAAEAEIEHHKAAARAAVIKKMLTVLRSKKADLVDVVFSDLLKVANSLAGHILLSPLAFVEGEIGRWDGDRWISHKTFSGTEQALAFVATAMALSQGSPLKLLIFDELGRLDRHRRFALLNVLRDSLNAGHIDQFIVAGAVEVTEEFTEEINTIRV